ncbi:MAG: gamma carbonic anhydrase family protein [Chloroflexi bacterium]|nr:gamma carbonic anhydrase family protein [Chloroflexota bacterium]
MAIYVLEDKVPRVAESAFVHPEATVIGDVVIEENCFIAPGASLRGDFGSIRVGAGSNIQDNCMLHADPGRPLILGPNSHIGHGAILHGCVLHEHVLIGMGAIILDGVEIGEGTVIGAGAVITSNVHIPPRKMVIGIPGEIVGDVSPEREERQWRGTRSYQTLPGRYGKTLRRIDQ